jgi:S-adenosylmethionine decarboxylase
MVSGKHIIIDVYNIIDFKKIETLNGIKPLMKKIIEVGELSVVGSLEYQFKPVGATMLFLLSESHLSIHTYPETHYIAIDLYSCNCDIDFSNILDVIYKYFDNECFITKKIIDR